jgi:hypothetical protein
MIRFFQQICNPLLDNELRVMSEIRTGSKATARGVHSRRLAELETKTSNVNVTVQARVRSAH